jgi:hypothetical protein
LSRPAILLNEGDVRGPTRQGFEPQCAGPGKDIDHADAVEPGAVAGQQAMREPVEDGEARTFGRGADGQVFGRLKTPVAVLPAGDAKHGPTLSTRAGPA